jgi:hypothetical protein
MTVAVRLTYSELLQAAQVGVQRRVQNIKTTRAERPTYGLGQDGAWSCDVEGAAGEMAVAKWRGVYWNGALGNLGADDVGELQVRTTTHPRGRLILHDRDNPEKVYVLVRGHAPSFELVGWIRGRDGMRREYWSDPANGRPAYFVPEEALHSMQELTEMKAA